MARASVLVQTSQVGSCWLRRTCGVARPNSIDSGSQLIRGVATRGATITKVPDTQGDLHQTEKERRCMKEGM